MKMKKKRFYPEFELIASKVNEQFQNLDALRTVAESHGALIQDKEFFLRTITDFDREETST